MAGIILYVYFLFMGFLYADLLFKNKDVCLKLWTGGVFGNVLLMAGMIPFALVFGFGIAAHIALAVVLAAVYAAIKLLRHESFAISVTVKSIDGKTLPFVILPILLICILMTNHILAPTADGGVSSGQSTYGDLQMHLSFVTSIAEQGVFPPKYCQLSGYNLNYPFLADMLSSSLYLFKTPLRWAVLVPSYVMAALTVVGFYMLSKKLTNKKSAAILAVVLFFINGGFGFAYFLDGTKINPSVFSRMFTEYYETPTNLIDNNIRWVNTICDMIIPQRTTMAGWCVLLWEMWIIDEALKTGKRRFYVILGVIAGCMPMIHTHSLLALGMLSAVLFFAYFPKGNPKKYIINWIIYGGIVFVIAMPQLMMWTFKQTGGNESFLRFSFNWANDADNYFWFYIKNWGIIALFIVPAILNTSAENKKLAAGGAFIMLISEFILFQPNSYDNNKLIFVTYMIAVIFVSEFLINLYAKLHNVKGRSFFAVVIICLGTLSGALTIIREYISGGEYKTFSAEDMALGEYVRENTEKDAVFLTGNEVTNPIAVFGGRNIYCGSSSYVYFHGFGEESEKRSKAAKKAYSGSYEEMLDFCRDNGISYVYVGDDEKREFDINEQMLSNLDKIYENGNNSLYKVK